MFEQKPASAPPCWGRQYDESDKECMHQCEYRLTCKTAFQKTNLLPGVVPLPMYPQPQPFWPATPQQQPANPTLPPFQGFSAFQQQQPLKPPALPAYQQYSQYQPPPVQQPTMALAPMQPQSIQHPIQNQQIIQQSGHTPYFMQYYSPYPGETVFERLVKHMALRLGQVLFSEVSNFLALWRWPPSTQSPK